MLAGHPLMHCVILEIEMDFWIALGLIFLNPKWWPKQEKGIFEVIEGIVLVPWGYRKESPLKRIVMRSMEHEIVINNNHTVSGT